MFLRAFVLAAGEWRAEDPASIDLRSSGHSICFAGRRFGFAEFVCRHCGHPFSFRAQTGT